MKIGKKMAKVAIENPWKKPPRFPRNHTLCRITEGSLISVHPDVYTIQVDSDYIKEFYDVITSQIQNPEKYWCSIFEMHFFTSEWLDSVKDWAKKYFDEVYFEDRQSQTHKLK